MSRQLYLVHRSPRPRRCRCLGYNWVVVGSPKGAAPSVRMAQVQPRQPPVLRATAARSAAVSP